MERASLLQCREPLHLLKQRKALYYRGAPPTPEEALGAPRVLRSAPPPMPNAPKHDFPMRKRLTSLQLVHKIPCTFFGMYRGEGTLFWRGGQTSIREGGTTQRRREQTNCAKKLESGDAQTPAPKT